MRGLGFTLLCLFASAVVHAQAPEASYWRPSLDLLGTSERGSGPAYSAPGGLAPHDDAASAALGLDALKVLRRGRLEASAFALAHDPFTPEDRGFYATGRARLHLALGDGGWRVRLEDSPRLQRRDRAPLSDFTRNEISLGFERGTTTVVGLRVADRRRWVRRGDDQGFDRQTLLGTVEGGAWTRRWRLDAGPQRFGIAGAASYRLAASGELALRVAGANVSARASWIEPLWEGTTGAFASAPSTTLAAPAPTPAASPTAPEADSAPRTAPEGLLGPGLVVDPREGDEGDWNFGLRAQELVLVAGRRFGAFELSAELRAQRDRGPNPVGIGPDVKRDRLAARLHLRLPIDAHVAMLAQGGWQRLTDDGAGQGFTHHIVCVGLQLRP